MRVLEVTKAEFEEWRNWFYSDDGIGYPHAFGYLLGVRRGMDPKRFGPQVYVHRPDRDAKAQKWDRDMHSGYLAGLMVGLATGFPGGPENVPFPKLWIESEGERSPLVLPKRRVGSRR